MINKEIVIKWSFPPSIRSDGIPSAISACSTHTEQCVGSEEMLERMIRQKTGFEQEISIINARLI
ncbi:MAG: hypothetical protein NTV83_06565 [Aeromonas sp.]|nr:hypothetical protein [Aeromonas sp.]MCX7131692.1 hypothetical protein [Aeromonas sp.]